MELGGGLLIILIAIAGIWILIEVKRLKHKLFAIFLIALILFSYFSFYSVFSGKDVDLTSLSGLENAMTLYFSWLLNAFTNVKTITSNTIRMDWSDEDKNQNT